MKTELASFETGWGTTEAGIVSVESDPLLCVGAASMGFRNSMHP